MDADMVSKFGQALLISSAFINRNLLLRPQKSTHSCKGKRYEVGHFCWTECWWPLLLQSGQSLIGLGRIWSLIRPLCWRSPWYYNVASSLNDISGTTVNTSIKGMKNILIACCIQPFMWKGWSSVFVINIGSRDGVTAFNATRLLCVREIRLNHAILHVRGPPEDRTTRRSWGSWLLFWSQSLNLEKMDLSWKKSANDREHIFCEGNKNMLEFHGSRDVDCRKRLKCRHSVRLWTQMPFRPSPSPKNNCYIWLCLSRY